MKTEINTLLALASQLPTGLHDPRALDKLECELEELKGAAIAGDHLEAAMEAGDAARLRHCQIRASRHSWQSEGRCGIAQGGSLGTHGVVEG